MVETARARRQLHTDPARVVRISRPQAFEASHRYWVDAWAAQRNISVFGPTSGEYGHGHNYHLWATLEGQVDPETGMVVNFSVFDPILAEAVAPLDHRFLNLECRDLLQGRQPSTEVLASILWDRVETLLADGPCAGMLCHVNLAESDTLWVEIQSRTRPAMELTRSYTFSAAHRLAQVDLDDQANQRLYGKCANPFGHGHDYRLDVSLRGTPDPVTGMLFDLVELDRLVAQRVIEPWDHRHLNREIAAFSHVIPTSENVVREVWRLLRPDLGKSLHRVTLYETPRSRFDYTGNDE